MTSIDVIRSRGNLSDTLVGGGAFLNGDAGMPLDCHIQALSFSFEGIGIWIVIISRMIIFPLI